MTDVRYPNDPNRSDPNHISGSVQITTDNETLTSGINIAGEAADLIRQAAASPTDIRLQRSKSQEPHQGDRLQSLQCLHRGRAVPATDQLV